MHGHLEQSTAHAQEVEETDMVEACTAVQTAVVMQFSVTRYE